MQTPLQIAAPCYLALVDVNWDGNTDVVAAAGGAFPILLGDGQARLRLLHLLSLTATPGAWPSVT